MLRKVISGGQTGCDQAALRAARACGLATGGFAPKGWLTEDGPAPWLAEFGLVESRSADYPPRTRANVEAADATLLLVWGVVGYGSRGSRLVLRLCGELNKPITTIDLHRMAAPDAAKLLPDAAVLNVAGNRESAREGIGARAEAFLIDLFRLRARP